MSTVRQVVRCAAFLAVLASGLCQAQIVPPVAKGSGTLNLGALYGPARDRIILVDMTVRQDGSVGDLEVVTGFFDDEYRASALAALGRLRFEPARRDGVPVDFYGYRTVLTTRKSFTMSTHPGFQHDYEKVAELVKGGDLAGAVAQIQDLIRNRIVTVSEYALLNEALVPLYVQLKRPFDALRASRIATLHSGNQQAEYFTGTHIQANDPRWPYMLPKDAVVAGLRQRFMLAMALERYAEANGTYNELRGVTDLADDDPVVVRARELENRRRSPEALSMHGKIEQGEWEYSPLRRLVSARPAAGASLRSVDIKCRLHREKMAFDPDHDLLLPPPWGPCTLTFHGDEGADILVTERALPAGGF